MAGNDLRRSVPVRSEPALTDAARYDNAMAQLLWRSLPQGTAVCGPDETASYYVRQAPLAGFWIGGCQGADAVDTVDMAPGPATEKLRYRAAPLWTTRFEHVRGAEQQPHDIDADSIGPAKIEVTPFKALRCR